MDDDFFRASVGALITDGENGVLVGERDDVPGSWQAPQGGIRPDETPEGALWRELDEETGLQPDELTLIAVHPRWLVYELPERDRSPKTGRGQAQRWHLLRYATSGRSIPEPPAGAEFRRFRWVSTSEFVEQAWEIRRPIYRQLIDMWADHFNA